MKQLDTGSAGASPAMSAQRERTSAPAAVADGASALPVIAGLLEYPDSDWPAKVKTALDVDVTSDFCRAVEFISLSELQELYARTFDLNPACALEVGYHLFGENYKRGEFLANLRETEAPFDIGQANQLPDYLPVLLRLLTKLDEEDLRLSLITQCLIPALEKMLGTFRDGANPYSSLLAAVRQTLQSEAGTPRTEPLPNPVHRRASLPVVNANFMAASPELF